MWINPEYEYSYLQKLALNVLKQGVVPQHVAFIMDGNRRHAMSQGLQRIEGHKQGFAKLSEVLRWCYDFGIKEVSVYAFSIENFKRPATEVSFIMDFAAEQLEELFEKKMELTEQGIRVRILGNLKLLPQKVQQAAAKVMLITRNNSRATLNIMMSYTTRDELTSAVETIRCAVQTGVIQESDVSDEVISRSSQLRACRPLDIMVRTSGEVRLSDFMVWQASCSASLFSFVSANWPTFSFWQLSAAVMQFQASSAITGRTPAKNRMHDSLRRPVSFAMQLFCHPLEPLFARFAEEIHKCHGDSSPADKTDETAKTTRLAVYYATMEREYLTDLRRMASMSVNHES